MEWRPPPVYVMDGGIRKAFDFVSHKAFADAAREEGMDEVLEWISMNTSSD